MTVPVQFALSTKKYDKLMALTKWYNDMPEWLDKEESPFPDSFHESVDDMKAELAPSFKKLGLDEDQYYLDRIDTIDGLLLMIVCDQTKVDGDKDQFWPIHLIRT